jgi:hypothetical protein
MAAAELDEDGTGARVEEVGSDTLDKDELVEDGRGTVVVVGEVTAEERDIVDGDGAGICWSMPMLSTLMVIL